MSDDLFGGMFDPTAEVETPVEIPSTFEGATTVKRSFEKGTRPLFTHDAPVLPSSSLNIDLTGNETMQSIDEILAGVKNDE